MGVLSTGSCLEASISESAGEVGDKSTRAAIEAAVVSTASCTTSMGVDRTLPDAAGAEASASMRRDFAAPLAREAPVEPAGGTGDPRSVFVALEATPSPCIEGRTSVSDCGYGVPCESLDEAMANVTDTQVERLA